MGLSRSVALHSDCWKGSCEKVNQDLIPRFFPVNLILCQFYCWSNLRRIEWGILLPDTMNTCSGYQLSRKAWLDKPNLAHSHEVITMSKSKRKRAKAEYVSTSLQSQIVLLPELLTELNHLAQIPLWPLLVYKKYKKYKNYIYQAGPPGSDVSRFSWCSKNRCCSPGPGFRLVNMTVNLQDQGFKKYRCYGLNDCVPTKFICWSPIS